MAQKVIYRSGIGTDATTERDKVDLSNGLRLMLRKK